MRTVTFAGLAFPAFLCILVLVGCTKNIAPTPLSSAPEPRAATATESLREVTVAADSASFTSTAAAKPKVRKKSCKDVAPFQLDCAEGDLYSGVEPMHHPIDDKCPTEGTASSDALKLEYSTKNNLCATGAPIPVTMSDFFTLQADLDRCPNLNVGSLQHPPADRACLDGLASGAKHLGEGSIVRLVAYVQGSHVNSGEGVNCNCTDVGANDFHVTLVANKGDLPCSGIVVEMIPHFRPEEWTNADVEALNAKGTPVRLEGPLFADTGHLPKACGSTSTRNDPPRASVWEIHPIKRFQVCRFKTRAKCKLDDDSVWDEMPTPTNENNG